MLNELKDIEIENDGEKGNVQMVEENLPLFAMVFYLCRIGEYEKGLNLLERYTDIE